MQSGSFARMTTATATSQREANPVGGIAGAMVNHVVNFKCTPPTPFSKGGGVEMGDTFKDKELGDFAELLITFCQGGLDILENDTLTSGTLTYEIRAVGQWYWFPTSDERLAILLKEIK